MSIAEEIEKLDALRQSGTISELEFEEAKAALFARNRPAGQRFKEAIDDVSANTNMWGMFIHLSHFFGYVIPLAGLIVPIVLWQIKKHDSAVIDQHGRIVVNWIITEFILGIVFAILCFAVIGIPLLMALAVVSIIFPVIGAVKANNGEVWRYPGSITFFQVSGD